MYNGAPGGQPPPPGVPGAGQQQQQAAGGAQQQQQQHPTVAAPAGSAAAEENKGLTAEDRRGAGAVKALAEATRRERATVNFIFARYVCSNGMVSDFNVER